MPRFAVIPFIVFSAAVLCSAPALGARGRPRKAASATGAGPEALSVQQAVARATENNDLVRKQRLSFDSAETLYLDARDKMFLPGISLQAESSANYPLGRLPDPPAAAAGDFRGRGYPASSIALSLGSYTLFNFWRDRITFDIARLNFTREGERLRELERQTKFQVVGQYFKFKTES